MATDCCNGHEAATLDDRAHELAMSMAEDVSNEDAYKFAVNTRMSVLDSILEHFASVARWGEIMAMWGEASEFALYGGAADEGAAHEPEEEIPGERPLC